MKFFILVNFLVIVASVIQTVCGKSVEPLEKEISATFEFKQDNGYQRIEEVKYNRPTSENSTSEKPVEFKGGYSYISTDGYEYSVKYKANKNGFQPYVTAHKLKTTDK